MTFIRGENHYKYAIYDIKLIIYSKIKFEIKYDKY